MLVQCRKQDNATVPIYEVGECISRKHDSNSPVVERLVENVNYVFIILVTVIVLTISIIVFIKIKRKRT